MEVLQLLHYSSMCRDAKKAANVEFFEDGDRAILLQIQLRSRDDEYKLSIMETYEQIVSMTCCIHSCFSK